MDAYDIFKKLSKGLKFKTRVIGVKSKEPQITPMEILKEEPDIKEEVPSDEENSGNEDQSRSGTENESEQSECEQEDLQILEGVTVGKKRKKKNKKEKSEDLKKKLELEEQNHFRNTYGIKAVGRHIPPALKDFSDLATRYNVSDAIIETVKKCGYSEPTPIQRQALPCMLEGRQIFACAPTGSGKTAAFLLPLLHSLGSPQGGPRALVLCPTRELAVQIYGEALRLSEGTSLRCSMVRKMQASKIKERVSTIRKSDIVISTPNRLCYLLNQDNVNLKLDKVRWLVIDEADKLFEGKEDQESDFRQQLEQIMSVTESSERRVAMLSATHSAAAARWSRHHLRGVINVTVGHRNTATSSVEQELLFCGNEGGKIIAFRQLIQKGLNPPVLVFVQSKDRAKQLFKELIYDGINVDVIHADRTQAQRDNVVRSFRTGRIWVLICTELMGRGIDFRGVNLVVNYDFPPSAVAYIHRVGRAGRAGQKGKAITFFTQDDVVNLRSIAAVMKQSGCDVPDYMLKLKKDKNAVKRLQKRAPKRDKISTILEKPQKRKLEEASKENNSPKEKKATATQNINNSKNKKHRKTENDLKSKINANKDNRNKNKKVNSKKIKKQDKKDLKKKQKKPFVYKKAKNNVSK